VKDKKIREFQVKAEPQIHYKTEVQFPPNYQTEAGIEPLDPDLNEGYLFHATPYAGLLEIKQLGFDPKFTDQGMFGIGCYFGEDMTKADQYIDPKQGCIHVILARVCMGNPFIAVQPRNGKTMPEGYPRTCQSTLTGPLKPNGKARRFREFVVHEGKQAYPEFILTLKRVGWSKPDAPKPKNPIEDETGHLFRIPFNRLEHLKMSPGQIARALNDHPELTVFLSDVGDKLVLPIKKLFPDSVLVAPHPQLEEHQQHHLKVEVRVQLGDQCIETNFEVTSLDRAAVDLNCGVSVPFKEPKGASQANPDPSSAWLRPTAEEQIAEKQRAIAKEQKVLAAMKEREAEELAEKNTAEKAPPASTRAPIAIPTLSQKKPEPVLHNSNPIAITKKVVEPQPILSQSWPLPTQNTGYSNLPGPPTAQETELRAQRAAFLFKIDKIYGRQQFVQGMNFLYAGHTKESLLHISNSAKEDYIPACIMWCALCLGDFGALLDKTDLSQARKKQLHFIRYLEPQNKNAEINFLFGYCYEFALGTKKNEDKAIEYYRTAADSGHPLAQLKLCEYWRKEKDPIKSFAYIQSAADQNCAIGQLITAWFYHIGFGVPKNDQLAFRYFRLFVDQNPTIHSHKPAQEDLFKALKNSDPSDEERQVGLGMCYENGVGVPKDLAFAFQCYSEGAQKNPIADLRLGRCYEKGIGVKQDQETAFKWYQSSAINGNNEAQFRLAICFEKGHGTQQNQQRAAEYYQASAEQGNAEAQFKLADCYQHGLGVDQDYQTAILYFLAIKCFQPMAEEGNAEAHYRMAQCYEHRGLMHDEQMALKYLHSAAEKGHPEAMFMLGSYYSSGSGVPKDDEVAFKYLNVSANKYNNPSARVQLAKAWNNHKM